MKLFHHIIAASLWLSSALGQELPISFNQPTAGEPPKKEAQPSPQTEAVPPSVTPAEPSPVPKRPTALVGEIQASAEVSLKRATLYQVGHSKAEKVAALQQILSTAPQLAGLNDAFGVPIHGGINDPVEDPKSKVSSAPSIIEDPDALFPAAFSMLSVSLYCEKEGWFTIGDQEVGVGDTLTVQFRDKKFRGLVQKIAVGKATIKSRNSERKVELAMPTDEETIPTSSEEKDPLVPDKVRRVNLQQKQEPIHQAARQ